MKNQIKVHFVDEDFKINQQLERCFERFNFKGEYLTSLNHYSQKEHNLYIGLKLEKIMTRDKYYKLSWFEVGACCGNICKKNNLDLIEVNLTESQSETFNSWQYREFNLGLKQSYYTFYKYLEKKAKKFPEIKFNGLSLKISKETQNSIAQLDKVLTTCRDLVNDTPEAVNPSSVSQIIKKTFISQPAVTLKIFSHAKIQSLKMNAIDAVGRASRHKPILVDIEIKPKEKVKKKICLVGKGVTYDSGGMDIKISGGMKNMKTDTAGAFTVLSVAEYFSKIRLKNTQVNVVAAFVENMISPESYKADDIITTYSGQTVEIINTDAEGRLILADCLTYSSLKDPDVILDVATLTGMSMIANHPSYSALMGNENQYINSLYKHLVKNGERTVINEMPLYLKNDLKGNFSDYINLANSVKVGSIVSAGHLTAGLFLTFFTDQTKFRNKDLKIKNPKAYPHLHLDIAGTAYNNGINQLKTDGATGQSLRSIVDWIDEIDLE